MLNFLDKHGSVLSGSIFVIEVVAGKDISQLSIFQEEEEVLIGPNSFYQVTEVIKDDVARKAVLVPQLCGYLLGDVDMYLLKHLG